MKGKKEDTEATFQAANDSENPSDHRRQLELRRDRLCWTGFISAAGFTVLFLALFLKAITRLL